MLRRASVLLGLAVMLSLLFPMRAVLQESGVDPLHLWLPGLDLAGLCALAAVLPAMLLCRDAKIDARIPRWNVWVVLLALFSLLFLLLHVGWSLEALTGLVRDAVAPGGSLPLAVPHERILHGAELAARLGVLVCLVGVLVNLRSVPADDAPLPRRKRK